MVNREVVAFVTMEILIDKLPTYAGGLGILAGDFIESAADLNIPVVAVSLIHRKGYVEHRIENGKIIDADEDYEPLEYFEKVDKTYKIELKDFTVYFTVWKKRIKNNYILLLDTNVPENARELRTLTDKLYIENSIEERILKELVLGIGTLDVLSDLGFNVNKYHINETHGGFLAIELYKRTRNFDYIKKKVVFTTHTPLPHGHEKFPYELVEKYYEIPSELKKISPNVLNLSKILFELSGFSNAVSWKHYYVTKKLIPYSRLTDYITNGVYHLRWVHEVLKKIYDKYLPGWREDPTKLAYAKNIPREIIIEAKKKMKEELVEYVNSNAIYNRQFRDEGFIITARRRITGYKRVNLIFRDVETLEKLAKEYGVQVLISGVTHPKDLEGKRVILEILDKMSVLKHTSVAFIPRRGVEVEKYIISGSDLFLHTPKPPYEACGTSWMRAGINTVPVLASRDGGVIEIVVDGYNGWLFGPNSYEPYDDSRDYIDFYNKLEKILQIYKFDFFSFIDICLNALRSIGPLFNSYRMVLEYVNKAYNV